MKKIARVFVIAVLAPSLVLAGLATHLLQSQQIILERQQFLYCQGVADALAAQVDKLLTEQQAEFGQQVEALLARKDAATIATAFDDRLRTAWPPAEIGFVVNSQGNLSCPVPAASPAASFFCTSFGEFLGNRQVAEVFVNYGANNKAVFNDKSQLNNGNVPVVVSSTPNGSVITNITISQNGAQPQVPEQYLSQVDNYFNGAVNANADNNTRTNTLKSGQQVVRNVVPRQQEASAQNLSLQSKVTSAQCEFRELVGDSSDGSVARFVGNKLNVLLWHQSPRDTNLIFGTQLSLARLKDCLRPVVAQLSADLGQDMVVALLDDMAHPVALSNPGFSANWKHPFVATEVGEALPHWELAVYLINPEKLAQSARALKLTFGLIIALLLVSIAAGGWLIFADINRQLTLARQKTDFVSNVSHELKTPLTSIRMFSELLAEGRVAEPDKRHSYLNIISAEASRLTRLINNVLDFSRMERGEKKYNFQPCDLTGLVRETVETYRPHLESSGFKVIADFPDRDISINCDRDALSQIVVNLLSNAEKYSNGGKEITVELAELREPLPHVEVRVLDRGNGVPAACEEKIFEQFFRAHDSLSSGIQGSGLGLTLARQIARAHGGNVAYSARPGGGSCFILRLPLDTHRGGKALS